MFDIVQRRPAYILLDVRTTWPRKKSRTGEDQRGNPSQINHPVIPGICRTYAGKIDVLWVWLVFCGTVWDQDMTVCRHLGGGGWLRWTYTWCVHRNFDENMDFGGACSVRREVHQIEPVLVLNTPHVLESLFYFFCLYSRKANDTSKFKPVLPRMHTMQSCNSYRSFLVTQQQPRGRLASIL